jgi:hypothetical protein
LGALPQRHSEKAILTGKDNALRSEWLGYWCKVANAPTGSRSARNRLSTLGRVPVTISRAMAW